MLTCQTCKKWVGYSTNFLTPILFLQTFLGLGEIVVSMVHHSITSDFVSVESASNRFFSPKPKVQDAIINK